MTKKEREDVYNTAKNNGYRPSAVDNNKQINSYGSTITHIGSNRTKVDDTIYYGASAAKKAIGGN